MKAVAGLVIEPKPLKIGMVNNTPRIPKVIIIGVRPILSDNAPTAGCNRMKIKIAAEVISVVVVFSKPEVLTQIFLQIDGKCIESQCTAGSQHNHGKGLFRIFGK